MAEMLVQKLPTSMPSLNPLDSHQRVSPDVSPRPSNALRPAHPTTEFLASHQKISRCDCLLDTRVEFHVARTLLALAEQNPAVL